MGPLQPEGTEPQSSPGLVQTLEHGRCQHNFIYGLGFEFHGFFMCPLLIFFFLNHLKT